MANQDNCQNPPFCIVFRSSSTFMFPRSGGLTCTPLYAHAIYEELTRIGNTDELLEDIDIDDDAWTEEREIERFESNKDLKQGIYRFLRDNESREYEHHMDLGYGLIQDPMRLISDLGSFYLKSFRGNNETVADRAFHNQLHRVLWWELSLDFPNNEMLRQLEFRLNQMSTADGYLKIMQTPAPNGQSCAEFDMYQYKYVNRAFTYGEPYTAVWQRRSSLFPKPVDDEQGRPFYKGLQYLAAAFEVAQMPTEVVIQKLDALIAVLDPILESCKEFLLKDPGFISKRRRAYAAFGVTLEEMPGPQDDIQHPPSTNRKRKFKDEAGETSKVTKRRIEF